MTPWSHSLGAVALISAIPMAVMLVLSWRPSRVQHVLPRLVPFAVGALFGAAVFHLIPESVSRTGQPLQVAGVVSLGIVVFLVIDRALHRTTWPLVATSAGGTHGLTAGMSVTQRTTQLLPLTMAGDALHNVIDGMLIATAFMDNPSLGLLTGAAIALHELPRELGTFAILVRAGMSVPRALLFNALTAAGAVAGAVAVLAIGTRVASVGAALVPFAAGNFLYLSSAIAIGEVRASALRTDPLVKVGMALLGLLLTAAALRH
ncbi:MAG: ZIP family metal transporter [Gemmatimonadaceae bacterium]